MMVKERKHLKLEITWATHEEGILDFFSQHLGLNNIHFTLGVGITISPASARSERADAIQWYRYANTRLTSTLVCSFCDE
jgi:hypothetical protein